MPLGHVCKLDFQGLAQLIARVCGVDIVVISERSIDGSTIKLLGKFGTIGNMPKSYALPLLDPDVNNLVIFRDVQNDPLFENHGLKNVYPVLRTMVAASLYKIDENSFISLGVPNVSHSFLDNNEAFTGFLRVLEFVREQIKVQLSQPVALVPAQTVVAEDPVTAVHGAGEKDAGNAIQYLSATLRKKQSLHEAKASSYFSLRSWRNTKKPLEQDALETLRLFPSPQAAEAMASEICELVMLNHGSNAIEYVVPIPPEKGELKGSLNEMLATAVAEKLSTKTDMGLFLSGGGMTAAGKLRSPTMKLAHPLSGSVLLVTDAAISHRRMDSAQLAVRKHDTSSFAISWIGP